MSLYVDDMLRPATVGRVRSRWSHLFADTTEELVAFAESLGLRAEWIQHPGTHREHFDVTANKRDEAIRRGAEQITYPSGTAKVMDRKRLEALACICDYNPSTTDGPSEDCPIHGRDAVAERATACICSWDSDKYGAYRVPNPDCNLLARAHGALTPPTTPHADDAQGGRADG
jgi:hypothetical protein